MTKRLFDLIAPFTLVSIPSILVLHRGSLAERDIQRLNSRRLLLMAISRHGPVNHRERPYKPLHRMTYYRDRYALKSEDYPNAERHWRGVVTLPVYPGLKVEELDHICETIHMELIATT